MRTIAIINQKGGSGKTTTAVNLSAALAEKNKKVLLLDLDPQGSTSSWFGIKDGGKGLYEIFTQNKNLTSNVINTNVEGVSLIPSSPWLVGIEKALAGEVGTETILQRKISQIPPSFDYFLIDCPPNLSTLTVNALVAVNEVLVPVEAHVMALNGLAQLVQTIDMVKERLNSKVAISGILACRVDFRTRHATEVINKLKEHFGNLVYNVSIRENIRLAECPSFGQPITLYDTKSAGAEDYRALAAEIIKQEKKEAIWQEKQPLAITR